MKRDQPAALQVPKRGDEVSPLQYLRDPREVFRLKVETGIKTYLVIEHHPALRGVLVEMKLAQIEMSRDARRVLAGVRGGIVQAFGVAETFVEGERMLFRWRTLA